MQKSFEVQMKLIFAQNGYEIEQGSEMEQLALDSLQFLSILCDLENEFGVSIPDEYLSGEGINTFADIVELIGRLIEGRDVCE